MHCSSRPTDPASSDIYHSKNQPALSSGTCTSLGDDGLFTEVEAFTLQQDLFPKETSRIHYYICPRKGCFSLSQTEIERNGKNKFSNGWMSNKGGVLSKFNGTSTPQGSYRAKTGDNDCNVNSSHYSLSAALCESIRYQAKSEQNVRQDLIPGVRHVEAALCTPITWSKCMSPTCQWFSP